MEKRYKNLTEFYPFYLMEHQNLTSRTLHFIGTGGVLALLVYILITQSWTLLALLPVVGYAFAWIGHFFFEKNRPATFTYPLMSLASDFIMFYHIATLQIGRKMEEARRIMQS